MDDLLDKKWNNEIRIIGGSLRKSIIKISRNNVTKPTTNRIRENVFNLVQKKIKPESIVLDLFAGSGALGIEAISRGIDVCWFVENDENAYKTLQENIEHLKIEESTKLFLDSADNFLNICAKGSLMFDLIFVDPPYKYPFSNNIINYVFEKKIIAPDGIVFLQRPKIDIINFNFDFKEKTYGKNKVYIFTNK